MTPEIMAFVLGQSLRVRLALLDADPTGPGWYFNDLGPSRYESVETYGVNELRFHLTEGNGAWLPCNPLVIAEHAARLKGNGLTVHFVSANWGAEVSVAEVAHYGRNVLALVQDKCPHTAAVRLLAEVARPTEELSARDTQIINAATDSMVWNENVRLTTQLAECKRDAAKLIEQRESTYATAEMYRVSRLKLTGEVVWLTRQLATARAEVERLEKREREAEELFREVDRAFVTWERIHAWLAGCKS